MNSVLALYSKEAFKEYILPSELNSDYSLIISKEIFHLYEDISLNLEVVDGKWRIKQIEKCMLIGNEEDETRFLKNGDVIRFRTGSQMDLTIVVSEEQKCFRAYHKYYLHDLFQISIGKDEENDIVYDYLKMISRHHAVIERRGREFVIRNKSANGIYINSMLVKGECVLKFGDYINILGLHMVFLGDMIAIDAENQNVSVKEHLRKFESSYSRNNQRQNEIRFSTGKTVHHRSPRTYEKQIIDEIEIEEPPSLHKQKERPLWLVIGPSITMALPMLLGCMMMVYASKAMSGGSSLYMYSGLVMSVSSALIGVIWTLSNLKYQKKEEAQEEAYRLQKYGQYLNEKNAEIKSKYSNESKKLLNMYPDAESCLSYRANTTSLWNRNRNHEDFLVHRLGLGNLPFPTQIDIPKKKFVLYEDELANQPSVIKNNFTMMYNVPITVDLVKNNLIGVVGDSKTMGAFQVANVLATQLAANNCYTDVKLGFVFNEKNVGAARQWEGLKWLPHVWSEDKKTRFVAGNSTEASEIFYELARVCRSRSEEKKKGLPKPYYVIFISDISMLEGELFSKYAFEKDEALGITTVLLVDNASQLPNQCEFIIENTDQFKGMYEVYADRSERKPIAFDYVNTSGMERFARKISNVIVQEIEEGGEIPASLTFFEMLKINKLSDLPVREYWAKNRIYENIRGIIGEKAGGAPCYLDVHEKYHGPHGLVAGTTGSGKSETLQTYMLSLAVSYSPDDIGFFVIDYKGGGMANLFNGLPHLIGQISNLSGNQVRRAMISIKSENRRRQRVFTENGVNNINAYTKLYKNGETTLPIPHLFIVIDEFAELKREEPEFMKELISVAQVGRSLGVHLILATQKPSGTVDDNIWSNSKFRLCLRVQDQQDSKDMLHKPDAAYITQAGRCYLQVGNDEVYELFQSGFSGAIYDENMLNVSADIASMISITGKTEIKGNIIKQQSKDRAKKNWISELIQCVKATETAYGIEIKETICSENQFLQFMKGMYSQLEARNIEYAENAFNNARMKDFLKLYVCVEEMGVKESLTEEVIKQSVQRNVRLPEPKEHTQLEAVKEYLAVKAREYGYTHKLQLWMPVLPEKIYLEDVDELQENNFNGKEWNDPRGEWTLNVPVGKMDDPENQNQMALEVDLAQDGNISIIGTIVSGKSTMMQSMAYALIQKYSPNVVNLYILDFSSKMMSAFEDAPHVGGVMYENDESKIEKFFNMIHTILENRKKILKGGNYKQYIEMSGYVMPTIVIFVDNYASFKEKTKEVYEDEMIRLSKEGISNGIFLVVSGAGYGMNDITTRVGENVGKSLCLSLPDKYAYSDYLHTMQIDVLPETGIKGRGLALHGTRVLEYQGVLAFEAANDYERMDKIRECCQNMRELWNGKVAKKIPEIPEKPAWSEFCELEEFKEASEDITKIPVGYDAANASIYSVTLRDIYCYLVTGHSRGGKTNYMKVMLQSVLLKQDKRIVIIDGPNGDYKSYASEDNVTYVTEEQEVFDFFSHLLPEFKRRNGIKRSLIEEEKEEDEIFEIMSKEVPYFIFISDLNWFVPFIYQATLDMKGFLENVIEKGRLHNIYFIAELDLKNRMSIMGYKIYELFTAQKCGIHFGGKVVENQLFSFDYLSYSEQSKPEKVGVGLLPDIEDDRSTRKVVVPKARK